MLLHPELTGVRGIFQFCIPTAPWVHRNQNSICEDRDLRHKRSPAPRNKPFSIRINADVQWRRWPLLDQPRPALRVWIAAPQVGIRLLPRSRLLVHGCHCHLVSTRSLPLPLLPALCISPSCGGQLCGGEFAHMVTKKCRSGWSLDGGSPGRVTPPANPDDRSFVVEPACPLSIVPVRRMTRTTRRLCAALARVEFELASSAHPCHPSRPRCLVHHPHHPARRMHISRAASPPGTVARLMC